MSEADGRKVMVVDDEQQISRLFQRILSLKGYQVATAGDAEEALRMLRRDEYGVLLLDLNLPGMNGIDLCRTIRSTYPLSVLIAITGYISCYEMEDCRRAGFDDCFLKPVRMNELVEAAESAFRKQERWLEL